MFIIMTIIFIFIRRILSALPANISGYEDAVTTELGCHGNETSLWDCPHGGFGNAASCATNAGLVEIFCSEG